MTAPSAGTRSPLSIWAGSRLALHVEGVVGALGHVEAVFRDLASEGEYHVAHGAAMLLSAFRIGNSTFHSS